MNEQLHAIAKDLAFYLRWQFDETQDAHSVQIHYPELEAALWISIQDNRLRVSGGFGNGLQTHVPYEEKGTHSITLSLKKDIPQMGKDIVRRLMPHYYMTLARAKQNRDAYRERRRQAFENAQTIGAILEIPVTQDEHDGSYVTVNYYGLHAWGRFEVSDKDVDIHLANIPLDTAAQVANLVAKLPKQQEED